MYIDTLRVEICQKSTSKSVKKLFSQIFKRFSKDFLLEEQSKHIDTLRVEIIQGCKHRA